MQTHVLFTAFVPLSRLSIYCFNVSFFFFSAFLLTALESIHYFSKMKEYQIVGRKLPTAKDAKSSSTPKLYKMRIFAKNSVVAKSRFFYFMNKLKKIKRSTGEIVFMTEVRERAPMAVKNFGIWLRYNSRSGTHNMYKEYREMSRADAVKSCYQDMAARHRARFASIHIIKVAEVAAKDVKRPYIRQLIDSKLKFPLAHKVASAFRPLFVSKSPSTF